MKEFKYWAVHSKLKASITVYKHKGYKLRFSKTGQPNIETAYSTHYVLLKAEKKEIHSNESKIEAVSSLNLQHNEIYF
jgi:hypothetical protein